MDYQNNSSFKDLLVLIPQKKIDNAINRTLNKYNENNLDSGVSDECSIIINAIHRYADSNIPVDYWFLDMDNFQGDKVLLKRYNEIVEDIDLTYQEGTSCCLAGKHGRGKTYVVSCILKRAVEKGYEGLYTTLDSIVTLISSPRINDKFDAQRYLKMVDFLVIDEFDPRFMGTSNAADLYGRTLEITLRHRLQNRLPTFLCTNSSNMSAIFSGSLNESISSLMNLVKNIPVLGEDFRPKKNK